MTEEQAREIHGMLNAMGFEHYVIGFDGPATFGVLRSVNTDAITTLGLASLIQMRVTEMTKGVVQ